MSYFTNLGLRAKILTIGLLMLLLVLVTVAIVFREITIADLREQEVHHSQQVIMQSDELLLQLVNMQSGVRGFSLAGDEGFLEPYTTGLGRYREIQASLQALVTTDPVQSNRLQELDRAVQTWLDTVVTPQIELRRAVSAGTARTAQLFDFVGSGAGKRQFDAIRERGITFRTVETDALARHHLEAEQGIVFLKMTLVAGSGLVLVLGMVVLAAFANNIANRIGLVAHAATAMAQNQLDEHYDLPQGRDEVGRMAIAFTSMTETIRTKIAEQQQTEEALRESEMTYRLIAENASDMIARLTVEGVYLYVSPACRSLMGYSPEELVGQSAYTFFNLDDMTMMSEQHAAVLDGLQTSPLPHRLRRKNGSYTWVETTSRAIYDHQTGAILEIHSTTRDITAQKQAEEIIRASEERLNSAFTYLATGMALVAPDGRWIQVNPALCEIVGHSEHELLQTTTQAITYPDDIQTDLGYLRQLLAGEIRTYQIEKRYIHSHGHLVWVLLNVSLVRDGEGQPIHFITQIQDISERKRAQETQSHFQAIVETSDDAIISKTLDGLILSWNRGAEHLYGYTAEQMIGQSVAVLVPPDQPDELPRILARLRRGESIERYETARIRKDGSRKYVSLAISPIRDANDTVIAASTIASDISERKRAEAAVQQANAELELRVVELQQHTHKLALLSELRDMVQACATAEEAYAVIATSMQQLFPKAAGTLALKGSTQNMVETVVLWGQPSTTHIFTPEDCWALRRSRIYEADVSDTQLLCTHVDAVAGMGYTCVPLIARGEMLGVFHVRHSDPGQSSEAERRLIQTVAEELELLLSNLQLQASLRRESIRDPLTGLYNRRYMEEALERELVRAKRAAHPVAVIMLDVDHFKRFNDTFGHGGGDALLSAIGSCLTRYVRGEDICCRYGGEEFTIILPGASIEIALERAEELREAIKGLRVEYLHQTLGPITSSFGVAVFPTDGTTMTAVLAQADAALYRAKHRGRDRVVVASEILPQTMPMLATRT